MHTQDGFNEDQFVMNQGHLVTISSTTATVSYQCWSHRGRDFGLEADQSCPWTWRFADFWRIPWVQFVVYFNAWISTNFIIANKARPTDGSTKLSNNIDIHGNWYLSDKAFNW